MTPDAPLLSVVIPTRDEAPNVRTLVGRLVAALDGVPIELCFVDDSDDGTAEQLSAMQLDGLPIRCLARHGEAREGGLSTAVVEGLHMARGTWVCVMDADLQHPPEVIRSLLAAAEAGADLVVASRYSHHGSREGLDGVGRRVVSRCATAVARLLFREARASRDPLSGFFLCRRQILDGIEFRPVGFKILLELLVCVPGLRVTDVPLAQERRAAGVSKASVRQGLLYLGHLRSLFLDVPGAARRWKFALVGASGLALFLPLVWALAGPAGLHPLTAFIPAFALSVSWNTWWNWRWTFADLRRGRADPARRYVESALLSGLVMFGVFALLAVDARLPVLAAGATSAVVAMVLNGVVNRATVNRRPDVWSAVATDQGVQAALQRLAGQVGATRAYLLPGGARGAAGVPGGILRHARSRRRPLLVMEAASHRAQRRSNIEVLSHLVLPVVRDDEVVAIVICERHAARGFEPADLEAATGAVDELVPALAAARGGRPPLRAAARIVPARSRTPAA